MDIEESLRHFAIGYTMLGFSVGVLISFLAHSLIKIIEHNDASEESS